MERNRRAIISAARRHLVEAGYHRLGLEEVAADAGVTRVTVYRHFGSKLGLLDAVAGDLAERSGVVGRMWAALDIPDSGEAFRSLVTELCGFWSVDQDLFRRLISLAAVDPEVRQVIDSREQWRYQQVSTVVARLDEQGRLRPCFDRTGATATVGTVTSFPSCDELAGRLGRGIDGLPDFLVAVLGGVVVLD